VTAEARDRGEARPVTADRAGDRQSAGPASGLLIVDKPSGWTSHDVVARIRRLAGTRRVGHAGTLDPMATGVLVVGVEKATRLLGYLSLTEKEYAATIRLGQATDTGDADGKIISSTSAGGVSEDALRAAVAELTGEIEQVPPGISAVKVGGKRAYQLARAGAEPQLAARTVTVRSIDILAVRRADAEPAAGPAADLAAPGADLAAPAADLAGRADAGGATVCAADVTDVDVEVTCSSGTYVRAIARDLGNALGVGGHLTALRRTRVGPYLIGSARTLEELEVSLEVIPLAEAAAAAFPRRDLTAEEARLVGHGARLDVAGAAAGPVAAFGPDGSLVALLTEDAGVARPLAVFVPSDPATAAR
jgi:tRNA pseudouridine55 synthase